MNDLFLSMQQCMDCFERCNPKISKASVGWHLMHALFVIDGMAGSLEGSDPKDFKPKFSICKMLVFTLGKIPKRAMRQSNTVKPNNKLIKRQELEELLYKVEQRYKRLLGLPLEETHFFIHPMMGHLNKKQTFQMMYIHTKHHLSIVDKILS